MKSRRMSFSIKSILLLVVMTERFSSATTNISTEIIAFCTCWEAVILCEDQTIYLHLKTDNCRKRFAWERPGSLTKFQVITSYNGTNVPSTISCDRNERSICKQPIVPFASDLMTFGFAVEIAPVCFRFDIDNIDACNCLPSRREITCRPSPSHQSPTLDHMTKVITLAICIPVLAVVCILSLIIIVRKHHCVALERDHIEHRRNNDEGCNVPII